MMIEYRDLVIDVDFVYHPGYRGAYEGGLQISPEEPECIEVEKVYYGGLELKFLSAQQIQEIEEIVLDELIQRREDSKNGY